MADNGAENSKIVKRTSIMIILAVCQHVRCGCEGSTNEGNDSGDVTVTKLGDQYVPICTNMYHILNIKNSAFPQHSVFVNPVRVSQQSQVGVNDESVLCFL